MTETNNETLREFTREEAAAFIATKTAEINASVNELKIIADRHALDFSFDFKGCYNDLAYDGDYKEWNANDWDSSRC